MEIYSVNVVEKNPVPKSQTKPFYIGTKEAPSEVGPHVIDCDDQGHSVKMSHIILRFSAHFTIIIVFRTKYR